MGKLTDELNANNSHLFAYVPTRAGTYIVVGNNEYEVEHERKSCIWDYKFRIGPNTQIFYSMMFMSTDMEQLLLFEKALVAGDPRAYRCWDHAHHFTEQLQKLNLGLRAVIGWDYQNKCPYLKVNYQ